MNTSANVLLTGASGFVGSAVLRALLRDGFHVRALIRRNSQYRDLSVRGVEFVEVDLRENSSLRPACAGCRYLFHVAADYRLSVWNSAEILATNVTGTRNLMEEALRNGMERVVYTSSVATLSPQHDGIPADEAASVPVERAIGAYKQSKIVAEQLVVDMIRKRELPAVIVNPSTPIGPRDIRPTPTGKMVLAAAAGRIPAYVDTGLNVVHVDDVASGHLAALERGRIGERYILGGENVPFSRLLAEIAASVGRRSPSVRIPWYAAVPAALAGELGAYLTGNEPLATWAGVRLARHKMFFTSEKAERELGYRARSHVEAVNDAISWFGSHGYLRSSAVGPKLGSLRSPLG
ncbi:NAD-dependent epimerase/dehydratase family protein [Bradyrhizobium sp. ISRA443]|uniref:hopanoid-associated sugar epimerase n=1 Tax=unclassified Bradyrhizobium TaxID=2631580 RepID=UPI00247AD752|nr:MULTISPECIES: hopanoid-associated sugar epimerase [unclassified Bradyrhizobium]WGR98547.1 NAD-dependent epimerase/dehydratase family protein [Bradyrhizobium sp. ISRA436]WGS05436.1 NAD-dependent epimerase/dehydratase family protein [Bradyrhizobium sp. ISRA437]WGS12322.1 NAD-dependent epimerase/dehydratase family protein [Bradyrhizobium sp. ISRA443]